MQVRFTVIDPAGSGVPVDVLVSAAAGTVLGEVRPALLAAAGRVGTAPPDRPLYAGDRAVPDDTPVGRAPLLAGVVLSVGAPGTAPGGRGLLELHVVGGPGAGALHRLLPGEHTVGRGAHAAVLLVDRAVSRAHAVLTVEPGGVSVRDLGSTNGSGIEGVPVGPEPAALAPGALLRLGAVTLSLARGTHRGAAVHADGEGHLQVNRPPRLRAPSTPVAVAFPAPPVDPARQRFPLVALLVPLALGPVLFLALGNPLLLLFMLMSPLMLVGSYASDRHQRRRTIAANRRAYDGELAAARALLADALEAEQVLRRECSPDLAELLVTVTAPRACLWERRRTDEDFLDLRIGSADLPARVTLSCPAPSADLPGPPVAARVPVTLALGALGVVGLAGPPGPLRALVRAVTGQLAGWHSPRDLDLVVLCAGPGRDWDWATWLPHTGQRPGGGPAALVSTGPARVQAQVTALVGLLDARSRERRGEHLRWAGPRTVVVLDGARALRALPGVARLLEQGPTLGVLSVCLERDAVALPGECGATVELTGGLEVRAEVRVRGAAAVTGVVPDLPGAVWAERLARALAPLRDATPAEHRDTLPGHARLLDELPVDGTDPATVAAGWQASPRSTRALVGVGVDGSAVVLDLARDGPHALVAGTTGSGKSELLQTLVASLALANRPDEMVFVLVDYKGGSAFRDCARLPHTVGMVTDLDAHLTERALASLGAELRRRKTVLAGAGCKDVEDYLVQGHHRRTPLPRLVLVIDEFATLVEELPAFVGGLVSIAQLGRSLGVHLVLATQRPAGVVSADIKANANLRIALRVTDPGESTDVIDAKDAALIAPGTPGRAVLRVGTAALVAFQCARVGGRDPARGPEPTLVHVLGPGGERTTAPEDTAPDDGTPGHCPPEVSPVGATEQAAPSPSRNSDLDPGATDLTRVVDACLAAARSLGLAPVPSPWLAPLPDVLVLGDLPPAPGWLVPLGLGDLPAQQSLATWGLDLEHGGHLLVAGGARSGRTTVLRTLAGSVAARYGVEDVHLFGLDGASGGLLTLAALPHTGAVVARDELSRADRLLSRLLAEMVRRQELFGRCAVASITEQRALGGSTAPLPYLLVLLDSWEGLAQAFAALDHGRPVETMLRLVREGSSVGLRVVVTGDRTVLGTRVGSLIADRLLLRLADRGDYALAGVPARLVPEHLPPGRGLLAETVVETQVALLDPDPGGRAQVAALAAVAAQAASRARAVPPGQRPLRVQALPAAVASSALAGAAALAATGPLWALLGVGGDDGGCLGVDLGAEGPAFVVAGPAGSGRSTTLVTMGRSLLARGVPVLALAPRRSPLRELAGEPGVLGPQALLSPGDGDGPAVHEVLAAAPDRLVVLLDDAEALQQGSVEQELLAMLRAGGDRALVVAGNAAELAQQFRGVGSEARKNCLGLVLAPGGGIERDLLGTRVPRADEPRAGRGVLVRRGALTHLQVALPG